MLLLVSVAYVGLLFGIAWMGDRRQGYLGHPWIRPLVYSLALAVYCSSWTFYGAVGTAARTGLGFLPIYLGPLLMLVFGWRIMERLALVAREQSIVSIADFLSSRYGRAQSLAALVALVALIAADPVCRAAVQGRRDECRRDDRAAGRRRAAALAGRSGVVCRACCWRCSRSCSARARWMPPNTTTG